LQNYFSFEPTDLGVADFSALHANEIKRWVAFP